MFGLCVGVEIETDGCEYISPSVYECSLYRRSCSNTRPRVMCARRHNETINLCCLSCWPGCFFCCSSKKLCLVFSLPFLFRPEQSRAELLYDSARKSALCVRCFFCRGQSSAEQNYYTSLLEIMLCVVVAFSAETRAGQSRIVIEFC
jgi:hypothetical protein